ncbi:MAG: prepilin peptidase [Desulfobacteraceae bacterium]|jgi:preprotein translocase subunit SecA
MYSPSLVTQAIAMRPGPIAGCYPERGDRKEGWLDQALCALQGPLMRLTMDRRTGLRKVAAKIGRLGEPLGGLDDGRLANQLVDLRRRFRRRGLSDVLCMQAFALIREVAWRTLGLRHYDAQLMGGWVMLQGRLAEMDTGEGKTLTATLAAATAALAGIPVHVLTVNEYLVKRDAAAMGPLYRALGLSVGHVAQGMTQQECRAGYACDITYCTNKQVAFDYLRDRLLLGNDRNHLRLGLESAYGDHCRRERFLLRGLCFAIIDEADSVLIDEARTPLILTRKIDSSAEHAIYRQALKLAQGLKKGRDFVIDPTGHSVQLNLSGQQRLAKCRRTAGNLWQNTRRREELVVKALHALHLLHKDRDYLVADHKVLIIDAGTGRTMPDRSWERGLHQLVEAKEGCPLTDAREQLGRLTYQRFFRRYVRLGGMTGTAREVGPELWSVYGLRVQRIAPHRPSRRRELPTRIYTGARGKWGALTTSVRRLQATGQPVLIGTGSVAESESLSRHLTAAGIVHRVLNARQDEAEAEIVAAAGQKGHVTVATNMAGRGTDIPLADGVAELGGLHVIATCRNEARRIDRQLFGRCARQGDPGSYQVLLSLEDELVRLYCPPALVAFMRRLAGKGGRIPLKPGLCIIRRAQRKIERRHRMARRALLQHDHQTGRLLAFSGNME